MKDKSYKRHIAKAATWRIVGTVDTVVLAWLISGDPFVGMQVGMFEVLTKMILYYLHERVWFKVEMGVEKDRSQVKKRHLAKAFSWRVIGTLDTMLLAWIISGNAFIGMKIGAAEVITKMVLYYLHERAWYKVDYGLSGRRSKSGKYVLETTNELLKAEGGKENN